MMDFRFEVLIGNQNASNSRSKVPKMKRKRSTKVRVAVKAAKRSYAKISMKSEVLADKVIVDLPIKTVSEANCFEPWFKRYGRHKEQKRIVALGLNPLKGNIRLPCRILLTRFAPDSLDVFDNLPMSFKYIVDATCAIITGEYRAGKADSDSRISIACDQVKSDAYGIRIEINY
jgi:hypothetical protein